MRLSHCAFMVSHEELREELIRRLSSREIKGNAIAVALGIDPARVTEIKKRQRRIQPDEMATVARLLGMEEHAAEKPWLPSPETIADLLAVAMHVDEADLDRRAELLDCAHALHTGLVWLADDPSAENDPGFLKGVRRRVSEIVAAAQTSPAKAS